jgi:3-hydroxyisobutyrate dehydrogenase/2-hydroxy-3-oxopropionate reductase
MGGPIARNLAAGELLVGVHNRTLETGRILAGELGVQACCSPSELCAIADVLVTVVADGDAVRHLYDGPEGFLQSIRPGTVCVEMSTVGPESIEWLREVLDAKDCGLVDAPVSGSVALAERAELTVIAGGSDDDVARVMPVLEAVGSRVLHVGPAGSGAAMKLVVNNVVYGLNQSVAESLVLAERAGIDRLRAYEVLASSAAAAPFVHYRREAFERPGEVPIQMPLELAEKDLDLILRFARQNGAFVPQAAVNARLARAASEAGLAEQDITAVAEYLRLQG